MNLKCPEASKLKSAILSSEAVKRLETENQNLFTFLEEETGMIVNISNVGKILDPLTCEVCYDLQLFCSKLNLKILVLSPR